MTTPATRRDIEASWRAACASDAIQLITTVKPDLAWLVLERCWNEGSPSGFVLGMPTEWSPAASRHGFDVPLVEAPNDAVSGVQSSTLQDLPFERRTETAGARPFPVHPALLEDAGFAAVRDLPLTGSVPVAPTASGRTVAMIDEDFDIRCFLKLDYPHRLGRFARDLRSFKWMASLERSALLRSAALGHDRWTYLPEDSGACLNLDGASREFGYLVRTCPPIAESGGLLLPAFSLWATPPIGDTGLVAALAKAYGWTWSQAVQGFVDGLLEMYFELALGHGLLPELNAQNLLYHIAADGRIRPVIRDMQDVFVDDDIRASRSLPTSGVQYKRIGPTSPDLRQRRSFSFDFKLGQYVIDPLVRALARSESDVERLTQRVKGIVRGAVDLAAGYWPEGRTWFGYATSASVSRDAYSAFHGCRWR